MCDRSCGGDSLAFGVMQVSAHRVTTREAAEVWMNGWINSRDGIRKKKTGQYCEDIKNNILI